MPKSPTRPGQCARPLRRPGPKPMLHLPSHWPTQRLENLLEQRHRLPPNSHGQAARIAGVEDGFSVDVGQAKRVAVAADAAHHSVKHPAGIGGVYGGEPQLVHHRHRARIAIMSPTMPPTWPLRGQLSLAVRERPVLLAHLDQADEHVLTTNAQAQIQAVRHGPVEGTLLLDRPAIDKRHLDEDAVPGPLDTEELRVSDEVLCRMLRDHLETVILRSVQLFDHGVVDHLADGGAVLCGLACGEIDTCEWHGNLLTSLLVGSTSA